MIKQKRRDERLEVDWRKVRIPECAAEWQALREKSEKQFQQALNARLAKFMELEFDQKPQGYLLPPGSLAIKK